MTPLAANELIENVNSQRGETTYYSMYSTWFKGVVTDPALMMVPIDDHIVHRGDGVFEAFKFLDGAIFDLQAHLDRLQISANSIGMTLPMSLNEIKEKVIEVVKAAEEKFLAQESNTDSLALTLRLYVSRGPGGFDANPYESIGSQLYIVATGHKAVPQGKYDKGVRVGVSKVPIKEGFFSQVKSCNYLPNVLMKKEAIDQALDFVVNVSEEGHVGEGPTENILILTHDNELATPKFDYTLAGTTLKCVLGIGEALDEVSKVEFRDITVDEIKEAKEVMMVGTTLQVLPVVEFAGATIGEGKTGPVAAQLREGLIADIQNNPSRRTLV